MATLDQNIKRRDALYTKKEVITKEIKVLTNRIAVANYSKKDKSQY